MMKIRFRSFTWLAGTALLVTLAVAQLPELATRLPVSRAFAQDASNESSQPTDSVKTDPTDEKPAGKTIQGANVSMGHNADGDTLWGFSDELGKLSKLKIPKPAHAPIVNLGNGFGFILADGKIYGFSAKTGEWSQPEVPEKTRIFTSTTGGRIGVAYAEDRIYGYSPTTGRWEELRTKNKPTLQFSKLVVDKDGETFIFSDVTGRWSSTADAPASTDTNEDPLKAEAMQKAISNMRDKGRKSSGDAGTTAEDPVVGQVGTGKKKGKGAAGGHAAGMTPGMPPGGPTGGSGTRGGGPMSAMGGMGMAGMLGDAGRPANFIQSKNASLLINDAGDKLWGYSSPLGKWTGLSIPKTDKRPVPTLGFDVGIFTADDRIYAYSSQTGRWDTLVTDGRKSAAVHQDKVVLMEGEKVHIFSNATGRWSSADDPVNESTADRPLSSTIFVEKFPYPLTDIQGRLIVRGDVNGSGDLDLFVSESSERVSAAELLESLKSRSLDAEREAVQRALEVRGGGPNPEAVNQLKARVEQAVREAFDRRQQAHRLEAEILRVKLQRVDARLVERDQNRDAIVARRLQQLIDSPETVAPLSDPTKTPEATTTGPVSGIPGGSRGPKRGGNPASGIAPASNARPVFYSQFKSRAEKTMNVGVVSEVDDERRILVSLQEPSRIHVGDELVVSRIDFIHEDGTPQYYRFARLFVAETQADSALAQIVELSRDEKGGVGSLSYEKIEAGQIVGSEIINPDSRPEVKSPELAPLQGRWRMDRWVNGERVMPPGNLKGSRHFLLVHGDWMTLIDPGTRMILERMQVSIPTPGRPQGSPVQKQSEEQATKNVPVQFQIVPGGRPGAYRLDGAQLKLAMTAPLGFGGFWGVGVEPGPDRTYWEFTRVEVVEGASDATTETPSAVDPQPAKSDIPPSGPKSGIPAGVSGPQRGGVGRGTVRPSGRGRSIGVPEFKPRVATTRTVGTVSGIGEDGRILLTPEEPSGIHLGDELVLSRLDFVHEDGTKQYNAFARLFVVQANPDSAVARLLEFSRVPSNNRPIEDFEPGQIVAIESVKPETRPEIKIPDLAPLQGRWRMQRWVDDTRVLPPGDLKGSRHLLLINGDCLTLIDPSAGTILDRLQIGKIEKRPGVTGVPFQIRRGSGGGAVGVYQLNETTLRLGQQTGRDWQLELEPGPDRTYWEFTRDETAESIDGATSKAPATVSPQNDDSGTQKSVPGVGSAAATSGPRVAGSRKITSSPMSDMQPFQPREFKSQLAKTKPVGVVSSVGEDGRIMLKPNEPSGIRVGDELLVTRLDFVREDGSKQFYTFSRLFVVQAQPDSATARLVEVSRMHRDKLLFTEKIEPGQTVGVEVVDPQNRPEGDTAWLAALQGRWRMERWVRYGRVVPAGNLKGSRHLLLVSGKWLTLFDPNDGTVIDRFQMSKQESNQLTGMVRGNQSKAKLPAAPGVKFEFLAQARDGRGPTSGIFLIHEDTLKFIEQPGLSGFIGANSEPEPGADWTYLEFTRDEVAEKPANEAPKKD